MDCRVRRISRKQQRSEARLAQVKEKLEHEDAERLRITNLVEEKVGIAENAFESYSRSAQYCLKQHEVFVQEVQKRKFEKKLFEIINTKLESLSFFREEEVEKKPPLLQNQTNSTNTGILRDDKKNTQDRGLENNFVEGEIVKAEKFDDKLKHGKEARKENQSDINVAKLSDPTLHHVPKMSSIQNQQGLKSKSMQHEKDVLTQQINRAVEISKLTSEGMKLSPGQEVKISESGSIVSKGNALAMKNYRVQNNAISRAEEKTKQFIAKKINNLKQHP